MKRVIFVIFCLSTCSAYQAQLRLNPGIQNYSHLNLEDPEEDEWEEDDERGWSFALNLGVYFGSKKSANIYNGLCGFDISDDPNGVRCYTIRDRLQLGTGMNTPEVVIMNELGVTDIVYPLDMHPYNMRYSPSMMFGVNMLYDFNYAAGVIIEANFMQLKAVDVFTLQFLGGPTVQNGDDVRLFTIWGEEQRFSINAGYRGRLEINGDTKWYLDLGPSLLGVRLESNTITVAERDYQLILGGDNPAQIIQYRPRTDIGLGGFIGMGVEMWFENNLRMDLGFQMAREKVVLQSFQDQVWNWQAVARFGI